MVKGCRTHPGSAPGFPRIRAPLTADPGPPAARGDRRGRCHPAPWPGRWLPTRPPPRHRIEPASSPRADFGAQACRDMGAITRSFQPDALRGLSGRLRPRRPGSGPTSAAVRVQQLPRGRARASAPGQAVLPLGMPRGQVAHASQGRDHRRATLGRYRPRWRAAPRCPPRSGPDARAAGTRPGGPSGRASPHDARPFMFYSCVLRCHHARNGDPRSSDRLPGSRGVASPLRPHVPGHGCPNPDEQPARWLARARGRVGTCRGLSASSIAPRK